MTGLEILSENKIKMRSMKEYFAKKNIFITGGTGFLGAVLIEALLSTTPDIGNIYILIRSKNGYESSERIKQLLSKPIFEKHSKEALKKVIPVIGDLTEQNFGFNDKLYNELTEKINIIYHSAATIRFLSYLGTAININLIGTLRTIEFAKKLKNYSSYIYLSTAFCNTNRTDIDIFEEKVYPAHYNPYLLIQMAEEKVSFPREGPELKEFLRDHPNTYTFTKQLAENLIVKEMQGYASGIVRPSVVYGTYKYPMAGWIGSANNGHLGFLIGFYKGVFRTMSNNPTSTLDLIPCDYVANSTLVLSWYVNTQHTTEPEVIHCCSGEANPLTNQGLCDILNAGVKKHPSDLMVWKPNVKLRTSWRYTVFVLLFHYIPALILYLPEKLLPVKKPSRSVLNFVKVFNTGTKAFDYFVRRNYRYSLKNSSRVQSHLNKDDAEHYNYDASLCNWTEFLENCLLGLRRYIFKESHTTTSYHRIIWNLYNILHYVGLMVLFYGIYSIFYLGFNTEVALVCATTIFSFILWL